MKNIEIRGRVEKFIKRANSISVELQLMAMVMCLILLGGVVMFKYPPDSTASAYALLQAIGSVVAIAAAILIVSLQHDNQRKIEGERFDAEVDHMLDALQDEVDFFIERAKPFFDAKLAPLKEGEVFMHHAVITEPIFPLFEGCKGGIGKIRGRNIRRQIVKTYDRLYGFVGALARNNAFVDSYKEADEFHETNHTNHGGDLRKIWLEAKDSAESLVHMLKHEREGV